MDLRGVPSMPSHVQVMDNILLQEDNPSGLRPIARTGRLPLLTDVKRTKLDMPDDIIIVEPNARIQRLSLGGLTGYSRSKYNMTFPTKVSN